MKQPRKGLSAAQKLRAKKSVLEELRVIEGQNKRVFGYTAAGTAVQSFGPDKPIFDECWRLLRLAIKTIKEAP